MKNNATNVYIPTVFILFVSVLSGGNNTSHAVWAFGIFGLLRSELKFHLFYIDVQDGITLEFGDDNGRIEFPDRWNAVILGGINNLEAGDEFNNRLVWNERKDEIDIIDYTIC